MSTADGPISEGPGIRRLERVRIESPNPSAWADFASRIGGRAEAGAGEAAANLFVAFAEAKVLEVVPGAPGRLAAVGWSVPDRGALEGLESRARVAGVELHGAVAAGREPSMLTMADPDGVAVEVELGHSPDSLDPPDSLRGLAELGHVVAGTESLERSLAFYTDVLGLAVSDRVRIPLRDGASTMGVFLHAADRRHHSLALIDASTGLRHVMVELDDLDAVGIAYDRCERDQIVTRTLGRHTNDRMVSFYAAGPDHVEVEIGCGGHLVTDEMPSVTHDRPSVWGHRFVRRDRGVA